MEMIQKPVKARTITQLDEVSRPGVAWKCKRGDNLAPVLGRLYVLQEMLAYAKTHFDAAWKSAVNEGIVPDDAAMRDNLGERIVIESNQFSLLVNVGIPRKTFSKDKFIAAVASKFGLEKGQLESIAMGCTTDCRPPLSKKVLEV